MARNTFNDGSSGDVVIRPGASGPSGGSGGFFSIGGGGGFGGGFGGYSRRRAKKRARIRAAALAKARAADQARREAAGQSASWSVEKRQLIGVFSPPREERRAGLDEFFAAQAQALPQTLEAEVLAAQAQPAHDSGERRQLSLITRALNETNRLIDTKRAEIATLQGLPPRFGDPQVPADAYVARLAALNTHEQMQQLYRDWEADYAVAHAIRIRQQAVDQLLQRAAALTLEHAQQQNDEDLRLQRHRQSATLSAPLSAAHFGGVLLSEAGALVVGETGAAIGRVIASAVGELGRILLLRAGPALLARIAPVVYSPSLGDGELSAEQRLSHLRGLGVSAELTGIADGQDLQAIADAGGTASVSNRIRIEQVADVSAIVVTSAGGGITSQVPVRNAVLDPVSGTYRVPASETFGKSLVLSSAPAAAASTAQGGLLMLVPDVDGVPAGVDLRFDDCIVCIPGQPAQYFSFAVAPAGTGVVAGVGQPGAADWWSAGNAQAGIALPAQVGEQLRGRTFTELPAFEAAVWWVIASDDGLLRQFDEINQHRLLSGYPPMAAQADQVGERRAFELRHSGDAGVGSGLYDLDRVFIHAPTSTQGVRTVVQPFEPWFSSNVELEFEPAIVAGQPPRTWTPLVPPGTELLGPTILPEAPSVPGVYPGGATEPVVPDPEIHPEVNPDDTRTIIPGFGGDGDLPSPDWVNYEPAKPLEVGEYKDLSRRSINDLMDVDHIVSRRAYQIALLKMNPNLTARQIKELLENAPSIVIPAEVHRKFSETYGGRNSAAKQLKDASDLRQAVDSNMDALTPGLLVYGYSTKEIEAARQSLHDLHVRKGIYR